MRLLLMALAGLGIAASGHAVEREQVYSEFTYSKQLLQTEDGARKVLANLTENVRTACQIEYIYHGHVAGRTDYNCLEQMLENAVQKIDSPKLTAAFQAQHG